MLLLLPLLLHVNAAGQRRCPPARLPALWLHARALNSPTAPPAGNRKETTVSCSECKMNLTFDANTREVVAAEPEKAAA